MALSGSLSCFITGESSSASVNVASIASRSKVADHVLGAITIDEVNNSDG